MSALIMTLHTNYDTLSSVVFRSTDRFAVAVNPNAHWTPQPIFIVTQHAARTTAL